MNYELSKIISFAIFLSTSLLWLITSIQANRVRLLFLKEYPNEAKELVTPPGYRSPKNVTFFFKKDALYILRQHSRLWAMRQRVVVFSVISICWPILWYAMLFIVLTKAAL